MKWESSEYERGLECAVVKMALAAQECELSPADLTTMAHLTRELQNYLRLADYRARKEAGLPKIGNRSRLCKNFIPKCKHHFGL